MKSTQPRTLDHYVRLALLVTTCSTYITILAIGLMS